MFQDVLDNIVSVLILKERFRVLMKLLENGGGLLRDAMLKNPLDDTASIGMGGQRENLK